MAISEYATCTETVGTTEWSLVSDTAGPDVDATDGVFQVWVDLSAIAKGDRFSIKLYEKVLSAGAQRAVERWPFSDVQARPHFVSPSLILMHGWDVTIVKEAGTDRSISASIRKVA